MPSEQEIRQAIAAADQVLAAARQSPYPRELFPELSRGARPATSALATAPAPPQSVERRAPVNPQHHLRPVPAAQVELTPEAVAGWSHELGFDAAATQGRITRAGHD